MQKVRTSDEAIQVRNDKFEARSLRETIYGQPDSRCQPDCIQSRATQMNIKPDKTKVSTYEKKCTTHVHSWNQTVQADQQICDDI